MIVYMTTIILILILGVFFSIGGSEAQRSRQRNYIVVVSILLIMQSGLRNVAVGADTYQYFEIFERVKWHSWSDIYDIFMGTYYFGEGKNPGYLVLQKFVQYLLPHYQLFLILIAIIFFSALGNFIYQNTTNLSDSVLAYVLYSCLFFSFFSITGQRQTIATAVALFSFELIKKRRLAPFIFLLLLAATVHKSVLVFIPLYFIADLRKTKVYFLAVLMLFPVLMVYKTVFSQLAMEWGGYQEFGFYESRGAYTFTFMLLLVAIVAIWRLNSVIRKNEDARRIYNAFMLAIFFTPLTWVNPAAMRVVQYFSIFMLVLVPVVIKSLTSEMQKPIKDMAYLLAIVVLIVLFINANIDREYMFFWQEMELGQNY